MGRYNEEYLEKIAEDEYGDNELDKLEEKAHNNTFDNEKQEELSDFSIVKNPTNKLYSLTN